MCQKHHFKIEATFGLTLSWSLKPAMGLITYSIVENNVAELFETCNTYLNIYGEFGKYSLCATFHKFSLIFQSIVIQYENIILTRQH